MPGLQAMVATRRRAVVLTALLAGLTLGALVVAAAHLVIAATVHRYRKEH